jgi:hypothetical protein
MPYGKPTNKILVAGTPIVDECVTEGTSVKPGLLVVRGTGDHQVVLAGAGAKNPLGVVDIDPRYKMADAFPDKHPVKVLKGAIVALLLLAASQTIAKGRALICAANGQVQGAVDLSVSVPSGATAVTSTAAQPDLTEAGSIPPGGVIVGYAEETLSTGAGETKWIMARLVI